VPQLGQGSGHVIGDGLHGDSEQRGDLSMGEVLKVDQREDFPAASDSL
jgi:hypothetical protein